MIKFRIMIMFVVVVGMFVGGCGMNPDFSTIPNRERRSVVQKKVAVPTRKVVTPAKIVPQPKAKVWEKYSEMKNGTFTVTDLVIVPLGAHKARVSGKISSCGYDLISGERHLKLIFRKTRRGMPLNPNAYYYERKITTRNVSTQYRSWMPKIVAIENPLGSEVVANVNADGSFSASLSLSDEKYFLTHSSAVNSVSGNRSKYLNVFHYNTPKQILISPKSPPSGVSFKSCSSNLPVYWLDVKWNAVEGYVRMQTTSMTLEVCDKITHLPISPVITVTGLRVPSMQEVKSIFVSEFGDRNVADKAMKWLSYLEQGAKKKKTAQSIDFNALVGATYKIETMHGEYYYFRGFVDPIKTPRERKSILLIEKGGKVRNEDVKEGEGGLIVDSD